jgi:hypothetical protein
LPETDVAAAALGCRELNLVRQVALRENENSFAVYRREIFP